MARWQGGGVAAVYSSTGSTENSELMITDPGAPIRLWKDCVTLRRNDGSATQVSDFVGASLEISTIARFLVAGT
jgi:hypothetical protein